MKVIDTQSMLDECLAQPLPVLIDIWGPHCAPCIELNKTLENLATKFKGKILFAKLDAEAHPDLSADLGVRGLPTLILFKDLKESMRWHGLVPEKKLSEQLAGLV